MPIKIISSNEVSQDFYKPRTLGSSVTEKVQSFINTVKTKGDTGLHQINDELVNAGFDKASPATFEIPQEVLNEISNEMDDFILEDDMLLLQTKTAPQNEFISSRRINLDNLNGSNKDSKPTNYYIIDKALSKVKKPKFELKCKWEKFPKQEIEMLKDIMDISLDEIRDYIFEKFIDDSYQDEIKKQLNRVIIENLETPTEKPIKKNVKK